MRYPLALDVAGARVLVVGGDAATAVEVAELVKAGARVDLLGAPSEPFLALLSTGQVRVLSAPFDETMVNGCRLVIAAATPEVDREVMAAARKQGVPVHRRGDDDNSSWTPPVKLHRGAATVAVFGEREALLERLVASLVPAMPPMGLERLRRWAGEQIGRVAQRLTGEAAQQRFWERFMAGPGASAAMSGQTERAEALLQAQLDEDEAASARGEVYLIGAGPGDPELMTVRALRLLQQAEVVLYDRLVAPAILELCAPGAEMVYVGKRRDRHPVPQESINELLVRYALAGKRVARLKGGDPFIFGRGGEEIEHLLAHGVGFQVVPGITAANGCAAYAGIPLTHRDYAQSCTFVTGHRKHGKLDLDFAGLVRPQQTLVIYMGLQWLKDLAAGLIAHGMPPTMPAALVQQGTTDNQRVFAASIAELPTVAAKHEVHAPTLVIVGEVVRLRDRLAWFEGSGEGRFWDE